MATELDDITVGIKTFLRVEKLNKCLSSLHGKGFGKVIVADDGKISLKKDKFMTTIRRNYL